jgi:hypothetical protein
MWPAGIHTLFILDSSEIERVKHEKGIKHREISRPVLYFLF